MASQPNISHGATAPNDSQQRVLERIALQRQRLRARRAAHSQAVQVQAAQEQQQANDPDTPLSIRLLAFARSHPAAVAVAAGLAVVAGPSRLIRWAGLVMPLVMRMRR
ncbi:hypothetical protein [Acidovorax sp. SUPP3334]|uniref:hypothetical protein n=1 Tax=Acidovorax sp. SUPP3334 TaxID=2920881 RepID=UPI0023DE54EF|nr:hypothetical protein [Acidovorax sp. SUPP3334]GKT27062.1 hypothetical protein AVHM3334_22690 [Acidovorax sp. SUPP3334]